MGTLEVTGKLRTERKSVYQNPTVVSKISKNNEP